MSTPHTPRAAPPGLFRRLALRHEVTLATAAVILLLAASVWESYRALERLRASARSVAHTHQVLDAAGQLSATLSDIETGARGFAITGDERYLEPYHRASRELPGELLALRTLTADNARQQRHLEGVEPLAHRRLAVAARLIEVARGGETERGQLLAVAEEGRRTTAEIRRRVEVMRREEARLLGERTRREGRVAAQARSVVLLTSGLALAVALLAVWLIRRDLVRRLRAESALREREERYRMLVEVASDIIYDTDINGRFTYVNPVAEGVLGYPRHMLLGLPYLKLIREDARDAARAFYLRQAEERIPSTYYEFPAVASDGREVWIGQNVELLSHEGEVVGFQAVARDITAKHEVDRMKDELAAVVSHELRSPLTSIRGSLGLMASGKLPQAQLRGMLDVAIRNTDRLIRLINDFLDLERLNSGRMHLQAVTTDLLEVMRQSVEAVAGAAEAAGVTLEMEPLSARVHADPDRVVQVLVNLLSNAVKFSPPGSAVTLAAEARGRELVLEVRDRGRGIPADKLRSIFERFQQVDMADSRQKGGTGLGLAITRSIVEQHGGDIVVESVLGQGSTFRVTLPCLVGEEAAAR